ncbi:ABC transporter permease [Qipengyuania xiapuensis]|uniref:ABC transporter permease n=1 Tax=Qipengyuania xiapuensis TaxID=2867236 RepID=A0ABX8ZRT7_9SPHN|nr:ABC transporter permease [Qipengyuania xiapuensis]QZD91486.1 ABC transporter permease [Qipengyuania xiapuensis]
MRSSDQASRLSLLQAAWVVARRDFKAILFSRAFFFFLLGPLFPIIVGGLAGGIGGQVQRETLVNTVALAMSAENNAAILQAREVATETMAGIPEFEAVESEGDEDLSAEEILTRSNYAVVVTGDLERPILTGPHVQIHRWEGAVSLLAAMANGSAPTEFPAIEERPLASSAAAERSDRIKTAQAGQLLLFLLMMLLAGMVLSNLVEEKANKVIEVLAAAIPMDAVFLGKLFAMLGVSFVGIAVWGAFGGAIFALAGDAVPDMPEPALGWPLFALLGVAYFAMGYLLLGSLFLTIGGMATTVREVQTLSMPVTMAQLLVFFLAAYSMTSPGTPLELFAAAFPLSSPFAMLARAAQSPEIWPHLVALVWQGICVAIFIKSGATLFRRRVMKSGKGGRAVKGHVGGAASA